MSDEREYRLEKLAALRAAGIEPYPTTGARTITAAEAKERYDELTTEPAQEITLAGRLMLRREMGKAAFAHIEDATGRIQLYFKKDIIGEAPFAQLLKFIDLGDFIEATGTLFTTRTGEQTLQVQGYRLLSKALR